MSSLSNIMRIDFTMDYSNWTENLLALFNINKISEEEVNKFIHGDYVCGNPYHPDIIIMSPEQFESVFGKEEE